MNFKGRLKYEKQNQKYTLAWPQCWSISGHGWNGSTLANSGFCLDFKYQGGVKCTVSGVFEDLLSLQFQKATSKIGVFLPLHCWLSQFSWDSQQGRARKNSILVRAFWNFKLKVLLYLRNCRLHATLIPNLVKPLWVLTYVLAQKWTLTYLLSKQQAGWIETYISKNHFSRTDF